jgi:NDP-sugar pyrophosphorylase family protein
VVLAGGLGTRLGERARSHPKYLLDVAGRPFASWQLERLAAAGYEEVVLCIGHLGHEVRAVLGDGGGQHPRIRYSDEGDGHLGTGGALALAAGLLDESFLVTYGDSLLPFDYAAPLDDLRAHPEADATMSVLENADRWDRSNVRVEGDRVNAYDKGALGVDYRHIDYGALGLRRAVLGALPAGPSDLALLLGRLARGGRMRALPVGERFYEIGSPEGLEELDRLLRERGNLGGGKR